MNVLVQIYVSQTIICKKKLLNIQKTFSVSLTLSVNNEEWRLSNIFYCSSLKTAGSRTTLIH